MRERGEGQAETASAHEGVKEARGYPHGPLRSSERPLVTDAARGFALPSNTEYRAMGLPRSVTVAYPEVSDRLSTHCEL